MNEFTHSQTHSTGGSVCVCHMKHIASNQRYIAVFCLPFFQSRTHLTLEAKVWIVCCFCVWQKRSLCKVILIALLKRIFQQSCKHGCSLDFVTCDLCTHIMAIVSINIISCRWKNKSASTVPIRTRLKNH